MAARGPKKFVQDMPPKGGFPAIAYQKNTPARGPPGTVILFGAIAVTGLGIWITMRDMEERKYGAVTVLRQCSCLI